MQELPSSDNLLRQFAQCPLCVLPVDKAKPPTPPNQLPRLPPNHSLPAVPNPTQGPHPLMVVHPELLPATEHEALPAHHPHHLR